MGRKRVLHIIESLVPYGAEKLMASIALGLRADFEPEVLAFRGGELESTLAELGVRTHVLDAPRWRPVATVRRLQFCWDRLREVRPDIVHTYLLYPDTCGRLLAHMQGIPTVCHLQGWVGIAGSPLYRLRYRVAHSRNSAIIAVSNGLAERFHAATGLAVRTVYNAIDEEALLRDSVDDLDTRVDLGLPSDAFIVCTVGRLSAEKNHAALLRCAQLVCRARDDVHFVCAGDGALLGQLTQMRDRMGLATRVHFLGYRRDVGRILRDADVFCLMSRGEGFGMVIVEAMFMQCVVVATDVMGINEIVEDGVSGLLVRDDDDRAAAERLLMLHRDRALLSSLAEAGRTRAETVFGREGMLRAVRGIYEELLGSRWGVHRPVLPCESDDDKSRDGTAAHCSGGLRDPRDPRFDGCVPRK